MTKKLKVPSIEEAVGLIRTSEELSEDEKPDVSISTQKSVKRFLYFPVAYVKSAETHSDLIGNQIINFPSLKVVKPLSKMALLCAAHVTVKKELLKMGVEFINRDGVPLYKHQADVGDELKTP